MVQVLEQPVIQTAAPLVTGEELAEMGNIGRCELVEGEIIMLSPTGWRHGDFELQAGYALKSFVGERNLGKVLVGEVGIYTGRNPDTVRGADVIFISHARLAQAKSASFLDVAPELVVEVLSPDDRWMDVQRKLNEYFAIGVVRVWLVDPSTRSVSVYRTPTEMRIVSTRDTLDGEDILPGFSVPVTEFLPD
jgi:Uma2 family endonuclease